MLRLDRRDPETPKLYDLSAHFLWIGERTRQLDGAHVAFAELLANPIGAQDRPEHHARAGRRVRRAARPRQPRRAGSRWSAAWATAACATCCPRSSRRSRRSGHKVIWQCDPMHGNTDESTVGLQDPPLRPDRRRGAGLLRGARGARHAPGRHPRRGHRRGRHRVPRRRAGRSPTPTSRAATRPPATPGSNTQQALGAGVPRGRDAARVGAVSRTRTREPRPLPTTVRVLRSVCSTIVVPRSTMLPGPWDCVRPRGRCPGPRPGCSSACRPGPRGSPGPRRTACR